MPIHLLPMTRREFLARAAGAGAALLLPAWARGAERKADPNRFALLSDTHVPTDPKLVSRGVNMVDSARQVVAEIAELDVRPAGTIVCGDLAHTAGLETDYRQLAPILKRLTDAKLPLHLILGNHDHRENFYSVLAEQKPAKALVAGRHVSVVESPRANWFLLDSLEKTKLTPGLLGPEQLAWLAKALDEHKDKPAIVMAHHDPQVAATTAATKVAAKISGLRDSKALFDILVARRHVKAYVYGHRHRWWHGQHEGLHLIDLPTTAYVFGKGQPSGWAIADLKEDGIALELRCLDRKHEAHGQKLDLAWRA